MAPKKLLFTGWRYALFIGGMFGAVGAACYPIIIAPMYNPEPWRKISKQYRDSQGIEQEKIQPGNMKVWSDPFDRKKKEDE